MSIMPLQFTVKVFLCTILQVDSARQTWHDARISDVVATPYRLVT